MSAKTSIAWTDHSFNPWWGCTKVDPGCTNCYADSFSTRLGLDIWGPSKGRRTFGDKHWQEPIRWNRKAPSRVFCGSMCDWAEDHPTAEAQRPRLWQLIRDTPALTWQLLTKRADRIPECLPPDWGPGYLNVWLGVSISESKGVWRANALRRIPARIRFVSYEPALGPLDDLELHGLHWIIYGGESGSKFRKEDKNWARSMRDRCWNSGIAFFHKQSAGLHPGTGELLDGELLQAFPV
jgi:protein gp37